VRKLIAGVAALLLLLILADVAVRAWSERRVADELSSALGASPRPDVSLGGFPFLLRVASGHLPSASVSAASLTAKGVRLEDVRLTLRDVTFSTGQLLAHRGGAIVARGGEGTAAMSGPDATAALRANGIPASVSFRGGHAKVRSTELPGEVTAKVSLQGGSLVLHPTGLPVSVSFSIQLPQVVSGLRYRSVRVAGGTLVLTFSLSDARFAIPAS
jgi:hypothetical protein